MYLAECAGALLAIIALMGLFYKKIESDFLVPIKNSREKIEKLEIDLINERSWTAKQQVDIYSNAGFNMILIKSVRACLDGLQQLNCNGEVTRAAKELDEFILDQISRTTSKDQKDYKGGKS